MIKLFAALVVLTIIKMGLCELNTTLSSHEITEKRGDIPVADVIESGSGQEPPQSPDRFLNRTGKQRIFGGKQTDIELYPYMVSVRVHESHICGASYIRPIWVLTAAHCLRTGKNKETLLAVKDIQLNMGSADLTAKNAQSRKVQKLITHENYIDENNINDIGLIKIVKPFDLGPKVKIVVIQTTARYFDYVKCSVSGWGYTETEDKSDREASRYLLKVDLQIKSKTECGKHYGGPKLTDMIKKDALFCAGTPKGNGSCQGDSGGPLVCDKVQVGVVAGGRGCGTTAPGLYTTVKYHIDWIRNYIGSYPDTNPVNQSGSISFKYSVYIIILGVFIFKNIFWYY